MPEEEKATLPVVPQPAAPEVQAVVPKQQPKFKNKASQEAFVSTQLSVFEKLLRESLIPYAKEVTDKIIAILDTLSGYNNKISMFLDDKKCHRLNFFAFL